MTDDPFRQAGALFARLEKAEARIAELEADQATRESYIEWLKSWGTDWMNVSVDSRARLEKAERLAEAATFAEEVIINRPCGSEWYADALRQLKKALDAYRAITRTPS